MAKGKTTFSLHKRPASKKEEIKKRLGRSGVKYVFYVQFRKTDLLIEDFDFLVASGVMIRRVRHPLAN